MIKGRVSRVGYGFAVRDWRSLPVFRKGPPGPDAEHCVMLILRGVPDEIEGGSPPPELAHVDLQALERAAGRTLNGWVAVAMPPEQPPRGSWEPTLGAKLKQALGRLGADGWMHEIPGSAIGLDDDV